MEDRDKRVDEFLKFLLKAIPEVEIPPFFAARVAARAEIGRIVLPLWIDYVARRVVPAVSILVILVGIILFRSATGQPEISLESLLLLEDDEITEVVTLEEFLKPLPERVD